MPCWWKRRVKRAHGIGMGVGFLRALRGRAGRQRAPEGGSIHSAIGSDPQSEVPIGQSPASLSWRLTLSLLARRSWRRTRIGWPGTPTERSTVGGGVAAQPFTALGDARLVRGRLL